MTFSTGGDFFTTVGMSGFILVLALAFSVGKQSPQRRQFIFMVALTTFFFSLSEPIGWVYGALPEAVIHLLATLSFLIGAWRYLSGSASKASQRR